MKNQVELLFPEAKILIIDDQISNINLLEEFLLELGYSKIKSITDSRLAIDLYKSFSPDIILLDLMMPYLSGFDILRQLNAEIPEGAFLPVLVLTADINLKSRLDALAAGANDFLSKPFDLYELQLRISNLLMTHFLYLKLEEQNRLLESKVEERTNELNKMNLILEKANNNLAVLDQAKNEFLKLITHEIRTPLNGILGFTEILKDMNKSPELFDYFNYLFESAHRLERFSNQALLITELQTGKYIFEPGLLNISDLLNQILPDLERKYATQKISAHIESAAEVREITGDPKLISLCLERLIDNAFKYSPEEGEVEVRIFSEGAVLICEIADHGPGFSEKVLDASFSSFIPDGRYSDGSIGLNLTLTKLIMDLHKGAIQISNNPEKGAKIKLFFN